MPTYELMLVLRNMPKVELVSTLTRTANAIFDKGGIIRKIENYGTRDLPYKISNHSLVHRSGSYFNLEFDVAPQAIIDLNEEYGRDIDIVRKNIFKVEDLQSEQNEKKPCTLHEEMLPPAYRKDVNRLIRLGKKSDRKFKYNSGLDYYPFQK